MAYGYGVWVRCMLGWRMGEGSVVLCVMCMYSPGNGWERREVLLKDMLESSRSMGIDVARVRCAREEDGGCF